MATLTQTKTQEVIDHHLSAFLHADVDEILKDFSNDSELLTPDGPLKGLSAIRSFFEQIFKIVPEGSFFEMKRMIIRDNLAYLAWTCESPFVTIPLGTDSFIIQNGKILYQTLAAHILSKET